MKLILLSLLVTTSAHATMLIGDSHSCGAFGRALAANIKSGIACKSGSAPNYWLINMPPLSKKDLTVVALGTNSLLETTPDASYAKLAQKVASLSARCVWVGPPHLRADQAKGFSQARLTKMESNLNGFYVGLAKAVAPCKLVDSRPATAKDQTLDGVHRGQAAGIAWAKALGKL